MGVTDIVGGGGGTINRMRILHFIAAPAAGGAEVYVKDLLKALKENEQTLYVGFLEHATDVGRSQKYEEGFLSELDELGVKYFFVGHRARRRPWIGILHVRKFVKYHNIDIYHAHLFYGILFGALTGKPTVYTHHSSIARASKLVYFIFNRLVSAYVAISRVCADNLRGYSGSSRITTIYNAVDFEKLKQRVRDYNNTEVFNVIAVGRLVPEKNYEYLLEAISLLPSHIKNKLRVRIVGEGQVDYRDELYNLIGKRGLIKTVTLTGNRDDVPELLDQSDLFLMTSVFEGLPIALIEATASGLPAVVTRVGGCPEIIEMCKNGVCVSPSQPAQMAHAIEDILENPLELASMSRNAVSYSSFLGMQFSVDKHLKLYRSLFK